MRTQHTKDLAKRLTKQWHNWVDLANSIDQDEVDNFMANVLYETDAELTTTRGDNFFTITSREDVTHYFCYLPDLCEWECYVK